MPIFGLNHLVYLFEGALWTLALSVIAFVMGGALGFAVALARISNSALVRAIAGAYVRLIQGTPLLILMFLTYFGLNILGGFKNLPALVAASLTITLYSSAFLGEIWRGCLQAVPLTQWEAAECLGLSPWQRLWRVVLPQAMRLATPPTVGFLVQIIKNTSLASVIGFVELAQAGKVINNSTFQPFLVYLLVAAIYFAMCYPLSLWGRTLERNLRVGHR